jgi:hypothetical protein
MDSGRAPERIRGGHLSDESNDLDLNRRAAHPGPSLRVWPSARESGAGANGARCLGSR